MPSLLRPPHVGAITAAVTVTMLALAAPALAQSCLPVYEPGPGVRSFWRTPTMAPVVQHACAWDPDGPGPAATVVVCAGLYTAAGRLLTSQLVTFDPATREFSVLPGAPNGASVTCLVALRNGDLVVGGAFTDAGQNVNVARWSSSQWRPLGTGLPTAVRWLAELPNGDVAAATGNTVQRWNGKLWSPIGTAFNNEVHRVTLMRNGDLVATGSFTSVGGLPTPHIARWNGTAWTSYPLLPWPMGGAAGPLIERPGGDLVWAYSDRLIRYDGATWSNFGPAASYYGLSGYTVALVPEPNGGLLAAGYHTTLTSPAGFGFCRWDGTTWTRVGDTVSSLIWNVAPLPSGEIFVGGSFTYSGTTRLDSASLWNGVSFTPLRQGTDGKVFAVATTPDGSTIAGGSFSSLGDAVCRNIARRSGDVWQPLGNGVDGDVLALAVLPTGDVVAGGTFQQASGVLTRSIARWNGSTWAPLGSGCNWHVTALTVLPEGDLVAGGEFTTAGGNAANHIARWNGSTWSAIGGGIDGRVLALRVLANGDLLAGGQFSSAGGVPAQNVARWDGTTWSPIGSGVDFVVRGLCERSTGQIVAAGEGAAQGSLARVWNGTSWTSIATNGSTAATIHAVETLPNDWVVAVGDFATLPGLSVTRIARWNGSWSQLVGTLNETARAVAVDDSGTVIIGGDFTTVQGAVAARVVRLVPRCPATSANLGTGCDTSVGELDLRATRLPWVGGSATFACDHVPAAAVGVGILCASVASVPLASLHPAGGPGCFLVAPPDAVLPVVQTGDQLRWQVAIPAVTPSLVGVTFHSQALVAEFGAAGLQLLTSSNAVSTRVGTY